MPKVFSERTRRRAKKMLAVRAYKTFDKTWMWSMPEESVVTTADNRIFVSD